MASEDTQFDTYTNDMWHVRHAALDRFAQAARKVLYDDRYIKQYYGKGWTKEELAFGQGELKV